MYPHVHCSTIYNNQDYRKNLCPLTDEWIKKCGMYIHTLKYSLRRKEDILSFVTTWMELTHYTKGHKSDRERQVLYAVTHMWNLERLKL